MKKAIIIILISIITKSIFAQQEFEPIYFECKHNLAIARNSTMGLSYSPKYDFDIKYYEIILNWYNVLKNSNIFYNGKVRVIAKVDTLNSTSQFYLNSYLTIDSVLQNNKKLNFISTPGLLLINLDRIYNKNELIDLEIYFTRTRTDNIGFYFYPKSQQVPENIAYTVTQPDDSRYWFPCYDTPGNKADSIRLKIIVPSGYIATGNGILERVQTIGDSLIFHWYERHPISTYLIATAASKYSKFVQYYTSKYPPYETFEIQNYQWAMDSVRSVFVMRNLGAMMDCFETFYGKYPFDKYGHVVVFPFKYGGMEHQTISTIHRNWLVIDGQSGIAHELAHQWWGDLVTCKTWNDIWLNEGFATFSEDLYKEFMFGKDAYFTSMNSRANYYYSFNPGYPIYNPPHLFNVAITYYKSALVLNMLRYVLGDSLFFVTINNYKNQFLYSAVTTEDFVNVVNQTTGTDYSFFFNQWIFQPNHPIYLYNWNANQTSHGYELKFFLRQIQNHYDVYKMPIQLLVKLVSKDTLVSFWNTLRDQSVTFIFNEPVNDVVVDPSNYILKQITRDHTLEVAETHNPDKFYLYQNYPNPFNSQTIISFSIPENTIVTIKLFDITGNEIRTLLNDYLSAGYHSIKLDGNQLSTGVYFYRLETKNFRSTKKLVLIK